MSLRGFGSVLATAALAAAGCLVAPAAGALAGGPTVWQFPSAACTQPDGLQACVDKAVTDDIVEIVQDQLASQFAVITRSLTLRAAHGLDPLLGGIEVADEGSAVAMNVAITGLDFGANVDADFQAGSGHSLTLTDVGVAHASSTTDAGLPGSQGITMRTTVPASLTVIGSHVRFGDESSGIYVRATNPSGLVSFRAIGNRISASGAASSDNGISVDATGTGSVRADIIDNAIWDVSTCGCGQAGGIAIDGGGTSHLTANVVGNTVDRVKAQNNSGDAAVDVRNETTAGGLLTVRVFNNVFAHAEAGIGIDDDSGAPPTVFQAGYNDYFKIADGNFLDGRSAGPHNLFVDPKFTNEPDRNLRLTKSSPVIDQGVVCSPGGVANVDARGLARLHGPTVDLGAYEQGAVAPTGVALVGTNSANNLQGTSGDDILCGMGGADVLVGNGGNDYVDGGKGPDVLFGGPGSDLLFGRAGKDELCTKDGTHGNDQLDGGSGNDGYKADSGDVKTSVEHAASCQLAGT